MELQGPGCGPNGKPFHEGSLNQKVFHKARFDLVVVKSCSKPFARLGNGVHAERAFVQPGFPNRLDGRIEVGIEIVASVEGEHIPTDQLGHQHDSVADRGQRIDFVQPPQCENFGRHEVIQGRHDDRDRLYGLETPVEAPQFVKRRRLPLKTHARRIGYNVIAFLPCILPVGASRLQGTGVALFVSF